MEDCAFFADRSQSIDLVEHHHNSVVQVYTIHTLGACSWLLNWILYNHVDTSYACIMLSFIIKFLLLWDTILRFIQPPQTTRQNIHIFNTSILVFYFVEDKCILVYIYIYDKIYAINNPKIHILSIYWERCIRFSLEIINSSKTQEVCL